MRRNRLAPAGVAAAAALALLPAGQPGNANPRPTDAHITSTSGVVILAVISRDANLGTNADAVAILNTSNTAVDLDGWSIHVGNTAGGTTASATFTTTLPAWQQIVVSAADYTPTPAPPQTIQTKFDSESADAIQDTFEVTLNNTSGVEDRLATADSGAITAEGDPATGLDSSTDQCEAAVRRDSMGTDTDNNAADFTRNPMLMWGTTLAVSCA